MKKRPVVSRTAEAKLLRLRARMDRLDRKLGGLLLSRLELSRAIIAEKSLLDRPARDPKRERELLAALQKALAADPVQGRFLKRVYGEILKTTVELSRSPS